MNDLFRALDDDVRRRILSLLSEKGTLTAGEISDSLEMSKPNISHHLTIMKNANVVRSEKKGQFVHYTLNTTVFQDLIAWLISLNKQGGNQK